jgi:hypothetical protein
MILYVWVSARREYRLYSLRGLGWRGRGAPIKTDREKVCRYNDDIQGTAGIGIADLIASAMTLDGLTEDQARAPISHFDTNGLLTRLSRSQMPMPVKIPPRSRSSMVLLWIKTPKGWKMARDVPIPGPPDPDRARCY